MQNRKSPEQPAHPMRSATRDGEAAQGHEARRSGQLVRVTGRPHTGEEWKACRDEAALVGGDRKHASRQACSRSHYQTGRVRLPGGSGLEGADQPGRRRAEARYVRRRASFGSLHKLSNKIWSIGAQPRETLPVQVIKLDSAVADLDYALDDVRVGSVLSGLIALISASAVEGEQTCCLRHAQTFLQSPALHIHAPYSANR